MNITTHKRLILLFAALFGVACSAWGNLWLSDSFHVGGNFYGQGALAGQTPTNEGTGDDFTAYNGAWSGQNFLNFGDPEITTNGLTYAGLQTSGGAIRLQRDDGSGSISKTGNINLTGMPSGGEGDSVYFSYLLQLGGADHAFAGIRIGQAATKDKITWGMNSDGYAEIRTDGNLVANSTTTFDVDQTVFIVGEILRSGGSNTAFLYLNPVANSGKPAQATLEANIGTSGWFPSDPLSVLEFQTS